MHKVSPRTCTCQKRPQLSLRLMRSAQCSRWPQRLKCATAVMLSALSALRLTRETHLSLHGCSGSCLRISL